MSSVTLQPLSDDDMQLIYNWVDEIPLSRPKKNITRDFSDGVLMAEVIYNFIPRLVEMHNYSAQHSVEKKMYNWQTLNQKVFKKMGFTLSKLDIENIVKCAPDAIEKVLRLVQGKLVSLKNTGGGKSPKPGDISPKNVGMRVPRGQPAPQAAPSAAWNLQSEVDTEILIEKEQRIQQLRETIEILEMKIKKLEQLVQLKDSKIQALTMKLQEFSAK